MIVVADTSPLNYLILLGHSELLPRLFGRVLVPEAVLTEMRHPDAPPSVREWASAPPSWIERVKVHTLDKSLAAKLGLGEREAISLAIERSADVLLIDELAGRREALTRHIIVAGTLAVLLEGAVLGALELQTELDRLKQLGFHIARSLEAGLLIRYEREKQFRKSGEF